MFGNSIDINLRKLVSFGMLFMGLLSSPTYAKNMPSENIGIWATNSCKEADKFVLVNSSAALIFDKSKAELTVVFGSITGAAGTVFISRPEGTLILPNLNKMKKCRSLPSELYTTFGEAIALFIKWTDVEMACQSETDSQCLDGALSLVDVSGDGRISRAEIGRILRGASLYIGYELAIANRVVSKRAGKQQQLVLEVGMTEILSASAVAALVAPTVSGGLLASYDYDGDGFLSMDELLQDRGSENIHGLMQSAGAGTMQVALQQLIIVLQNVLGLAPGLVGSMIFR